jgi:hypothetical protein
VGICVLPPSREALAARSGTLFTVVATFARVGTKRVGSRHHPTVLVVDVFDKETGQPLTDHLWFNQGRLWRNARLLPGDLISFTARVIEYRTGYWGPNRVRRVLEPARSDFRLTPPTDLVLVWRASQHKQDAA